MVAYPTQRGSSAHMCVAEIIEIIDFKKEVYTRVYTDSPRVHRIEEKDAWKVRLQPLHYTDFRSTSGLVDGHYERHAHAPKPVMVHRVENLVRVGPERGLGLRAWNLDIDYDHAALAENFKSIDAHDMSSGKGISHREEG